MSQVIPFSKVDIYLKSLNSSIPGCIVDTNFLVAATEELHPFYEDAEFIFDKLANYKIPIYSTVTTRSEFIDIRRRMIITEILIDMLAASSPWKISSQVRKVLKAQQTWLATQAAKNEIPILPDGRIKECKEAFTPRTQSGQIGWVALCKEYLSGKLLKDWEVISENLSLNYIDMRSETISEIIVEQLDWQKMYSISEATCLGSNDAMLLNAVKCSVFPFVISADYDLAYAVLADGDEKTILIPDGLYQRKIKGLKFS